MTSPPEGIGHRSPQGQKRLWGHAPELAVPRGVRKGLFESYGAGALRRARIPVAHGDLLSFATSPSSLPPTSPHLGWEASLATPRFDLLLHLPL